jgi:hypothetical protein
MIDFGYHDDFVELVLQGFEIMVNFTWNMNGINDLELYAGCYSLWFREGPNWYLKGKNKM